MNVFSNNKSVERTFVLYLLFIAIIPLFLVGATSYFVSYEAVTDQARQYTAQLLQKESQLIEQHIDQIENLAANISGLEGLEAILTADPNGLDSYAKLATNARMGYLLNDYIALGGIVSIDLFTTAGGHYHVGETLQTERLREGAKKALFEQTKTNSGAVYWPGVEENIVAGSLQRHVLPAAKIIQRVDYETAEFKPVALLVINVSPNRIASLFDSEERKETGARTVILDQKNRVIYHPDAGRIAQVMTFPVPERAKTFEGSYQADVDGELSLISRERIPKNGWSAVTITPLDDLTERSAMIRNVTALVLIGCLILVAFMSAQFSNQIVMPIRLVCDGFKKIRQNAPDARQPLPAHGKNEIGELIALFNAFNTSIETREMAERESRFKSEFLANMSHELRTPLNAIIGFSQTMRMELFGPLGAPKYHEYARDIQFSGEHLARIMNDVLDLSKVEAGKLHLHDEPFLIAEAIDEALVMVRHDRENAGLELNVHLDDIRATLIADRKAFLRIILNLLSNAIKFTPKGGVITISGTREATGGVAVAVADTGCGISKDNLEVVFEPFGQAHSSMIANTDGTGLGLSIVRKLMDMLGGTVELTSQLGVGTTVVLTFPPERIQSVDA